ncbi:MAG: SatD family protein [Arachnia sp.]
MAGVKEKSNVVALLGDLVGSRDSRRDLVHDALLEALRHTNEQVHHLDDLRVTVGDEIQGVYETLGGALEAASLVSDELFGIADMRFGVGGGDIRIIDAERGIQDGNAWWLAREAIDFAEDLSRQSGYEGVRTAIRDQRPISTPAADALVRLVDIHVAGLKGGARRSLIGLLRGLENAEVARTEGISASANTQRVKNNDLRVLADALVALRSLP